jgi:hypothetical protein
MTANGPEVRLDGVFMLLRVLAGRPGFEGIQVESLVGRQYQDLTWRVRDMEASVFEFWCASVEVDGVLLDPGRWARG